MIKKKFIFFLVIFFIFTQTNSFSLTKSKIIVRVNDQIISSYELKNKIKTMLFLSDQKMSQDSVDMLKNKALNKLIDIKLKESQLLKFNFQYQPDKQINNYLKNILLKYKTNEVGLQNIFINNNLDYEMYIDEIKAEFSWQQFIYNQNKERLNLDESEINNELNEVIKNQSSLLEYNLAEIEIILKNSIEDKSTLIEINKEIKEYGFKNTAKKYSIAVSSLDGGSIGWINAKSLSESISNELKGMQIGDISNPIIQTGTATILKILDKKNLDSSSLNTDKLRQKIIDFKKNELLNLYSNSYLSKIKNSALIESK